MPDFILRKPANVRVFRKVEFCYLRLTPLISLQNEIICAQERVNKAI